jgi:hypothetical protein
MMRPTRLSERFTNRRHYWTILYCLSLRTLFSSLKVLLENDVKTRLEANQQGSSIEALAKSLKLGSAGKMYEGTRDGLTVLSGKHFQCGKSLGQHISVRNRQVLRQHYLSCHKSGTLTPFERAQNKWQPYAAEDIGNPGCRQICYFDSRRLSSSASNQLLTSKPGSQPRASQISWARCRIRSSKGRVATSGSSLVA